tara:strand:+ start:844 stop:993 length:150 start_codon:yes stop_codon:yes gene_type:complete
MSPLYLGERETRIPRGKPTGPLLLLLFSFLLLAYSYYRLGLNDRAVCID